MKNLIVLGLALIVIGGVLMVVEIPHREKHEANILGGAISVTTKESRKVPVLVSGTLIVVGAAVTIIGAAKRKS